MATKVDSFGNNSIAGKLNAVIVVAITVVLGAAAICLNVWLTSQLEDRSIAGLQRSTDRVPSPR